MKVEIPYRQEPYIYKVIEQPLLMVLFFFISGIVCAGSVYDCAHDWVMVLCVLGALIYAALCLVNYRLSRVPHKGEVLALFHRCPLHFVFQVLLAVLVFFVGLLLGALHWKNVTRPWPATPSRVLAVVVDRPQYKSRTLAAPLLLFTGCDNTRKTMAYFSKNKQAQALHEGDCVVLMSQPQQPKSLGSSREFDYATYLYCHHLEGTLYLDSLHWHVARGDERAWCYEHLSLLDQLKLKALQWRAEIIAYLQQSHLSTETKALSIALSTGWREGVSRDLQEAYSKVGVSHVLALSGLHLSILLFVIVWLVTYVQQRWPRVILAGLALLFMWGFVFVVAFPVSLVRAAIMTSVFVLITLSRRNSNTLNALFLAALLILIISPLSVYDVGFQLSFLAVGGILVFTPFMTSLLPQPNYYDWHKRLYVVFNIFSTTVSAVVFTLPVIACHFGNVSMLSVILSPLVVWLTTLIMYLLVLYILGIPFADILLNTLVEWQNRLVQESAQSDFLFFNVDCSGIDVLFYFIGVCVIIFYHPRLKKQWCYGRISCNS